MKAYKLLGGFIVISISTFLIALALNVFIVSNGLSFCGVVGIASILYSHANVPLSVTYLAVNISLFVVAAKLFGKTFIFNSVIATAELSFFLHLTNNMQGMVTDKIVASIIGSVILGIGIGSVICGGGCTGGTILAALILKKQYETQLSALTIIMLINYSVMIASMVLLGVDNVLYSAIVVFGLAKSVRIVFRCLGPYSKFITNETI